MERVEHLHKETALFRRLLGNSLMNRRHSECLLLAGAGQLCHHWPYLSRWKNLKRFSSRQVPYWKTHWAKGFQFIWKLKRESRDNGERNLCQFPHTKQTNWASWTNDRSSSKQNLRKHIWNSSDVQKGKKRLDNLRGKGVWLGILQRLGCQRTKANGHKSDHCGKLRENPLTKSDWNGSAAVCFSQWREFWESWTYWKGTVHFYGWFECSADWAVNQSKNRHWNWVWGSAKNWHPNWAGVFLEWRNFAFCALKVCSVGKLINLITKTIFKNPE